MGKLVRPTSSDTLGSFLRRAREEARMTSRQVGELVGANSSTVLRIEQGLIASPKLEVLKRLANVLEVDLADLFALCGIPVTSPSMNLAAYLEHLAGRPVPEAAVAEAQAAIQTILDKYRPQPDRP
jgi:transcriptional regulator with XRE-family HTH domain